MNPIESMLAIFEQDTQDYYDNVVGGDGFIHDKQCRTEYEHRQQIIALVQEQLKGY